MSDPPPNDPRSSAAPRAPKPGDLLDAALAYAARGWPVFPCNPKNKQPLLARDKDEKGKPIPKSGGVTKASLDEGQIRAWWKKWPKALVGLATGHTTTHDAHGDAMPLPHRRLFILDFDPREDADTGEVWTLDRLKRETEEQLGCALPISLTALSPSDGVHLYLLQDDDGPPITNRGNLPEHVDVRGLGGYVIAPPSIMGPDAVKGQSGLRYRWHRREPVGGLAKAPTALIEVLRDKGGKPAADPPAQNPAMPIDRAAAPHVDVDDAVRKYAIAALDGECEEIRKAPSGRRNAQLNTSALKVASLVAAGALNETFARQCVEAAARDNPGNDADSQLIATIDSGWSAGMDNPRDLDEIASAARARSARHYSSRPSGAPRRPAPAASGKSGGPFQNGRAADGLPHAEGPPALSATDVARIERIERAWFDHALSTVEASKEALTRLAWNVGRRIEAGYLDDGEAKEAIWPKCEDVADVSHADIDEAIERGQLKGYDPSAVLLDLKLAKYPLTDFGLAERFRERFGHNFRFTTAKGWLSWDGQRWKLLDQDKDTLPAAVVQAAFDTVRLVQREARRVAQTQVRLALVKRPESRGGMAEAIDEDNDPDETAMDYWIPVGKSFKRLSQLISEFGRKSEVTGKPVAIANLARKDLTAQIEEFDCEQMAINVHNGTLRFAIQTMPDGKRQVSVQLDAHDRADLNTRLAPVVYDPGAECPIYDAMIAWAQPDPATRRYVHQVGGYACSGDTGEHKLWFNYGRGRNGKSTTIDSWCSALGDYSGTIGIESFLDQGIKKRGDAATPDLAKLSGVRMLRASEPERGAKLNSALVKAVTGGEPMSVRALHKGFFDLDPRFKLLMSGNSKPAIPDTDEGIWSRMKLVPWLRHIDKPEDDPYRDQFPDAAASWPTKDPKLTEKIKAAELPGVFRRLIEGLTDYLAGGFVEPQSVIEATADYRDKSDPLARFLRLCTEPAPGERVKSSELHEVFTAWCKAAGEREWQPKGFSDAMEEKGYSKKRSDGMRWEGLKLVRFVHDFVDKDGNVRSDLPDLAADPKPPPIDASGWRPPFGDEDDDIPFG